MEYTYEQRKQPKGPQNTEPERTTAPGPGFSAPNPGASIPPAGPSFDLDAAMRERMASTFGDLSAVRDYIPPVREQAPPQTGPYFGPVTHAISNASPSPSAAGPMQAKKAGSDDDSEHIQKWKDSGVAAQNEMRRAMDLPDDAPNREEKRPWQLTAEELRANPFNPTNSNNLAKTQASIDAMQDPNLAYSAFAGSADNYNADLYTKSGDRWEPYEVDPKYFKNKLKNMARMVHDYPELKGKIGNMVPATDSVMAVSPAYSNNKAEFDYNHTLDTMGFWGKFKHSIVNLGNKLFGITTQKSLDYTGTHELGHVLNSLLLDDESEKSADYDWDYSITSDIIVDKALKQTMSPKEYKKLKRFKRDDEEKHTLMGQIDLKGSNLYKKGYTSRYGMTSANEFFAEAFADVYGHGKDAKPVSIAVVREYESQMKELRDKKNGQGNNSDVPQPGDSPLNTAMIAGVTNVRNEIDESMSEADSDLNESLDESMSESDPMNTSFIVNPEKKEKDLFD